MGCGNSTNDSDRREGGDRSDDPTGTSTAPPIRKIVVERESEEIRQRTAHLQQLLTVTEGVDKTLPFAEEELFVVTYIAMHCCVTSTPLPHPIPPLSLCFQSLLQPRHLDEPIVNKELTVHNASITPRFPYTRSIDAIYAVCFVSDTRFVCSAENGRLLVLDTHDVNVFGEFCFEHHADFRGLPVGDLNDPQRRTAALGIDNQEDTLFTVLAVADVRRDRLLLIDLATCKEMGTFFDGHGTGQRDLMHPHGVCYCPEAQRFAVADYQNNRISFAPNYKYDRHYRTVGEGPGNGRDELHHPHDLAMSPDGRTMCIADERNSRLQLLDSVNRVFTRSVSVPSQPRHVCFLNEDRVFFMSRETIRIVKLSESTTRAKTATTAVHRTVSGIEMVSEDDTNNNNNESTVNLSSTNPLVDPSSRNSSSTTLRRRTKSQKGSSSATMGGTLHRQDSDGDSPGRWVEDDTLMLPPECTSLGKEQALSPKLLLCAATLPGSATRRGVIAWERIEERFVFFATAMQ